MIKDCEIKEKFLKVINIYDNNIIDVSTNGLKKISDLCNKIKEIISKDFNIYVGDGALLLENYSDDILYHMLSNELFSIKYISEKIKIYVKTLIGDTMFIGVNGDDTIQTLKDKIQEQHKILSDQQRLIFAGKQLEDSKTIEHYNIIQSSVLHLVFRLWGGGGMEQFACLDEDGQELEFSYEAPEWRSVLDGLSIFGICYNKNCKAYSYEVVHSRGFNDFELSYHKAEITCPICSENIMPVSCGFYNCEWSCTSLSIDELEPKVISKEWKRVENKFIYFDGYKKSKEYVQLKIRVRRISNDINCNLCHNIITKEIKCNDCNKSYHEKCLDNWTKNENKKCPECLVDKLNNFYGLIKIIERKSDY